jgi:hypothetical protein
VAAMKFDLGEGNRFSLKDDGALRSDINSLAEFLVGVTYEYDLSQISKYPQDWLIFFGNFKR